MNVSTTEACVQVMDLRIRIELLAAAAFDRTCQPANPGCQQRTRDRLLFVLAGLPEAEWMSRYPLICLGRYVYRRTCDVLHSRASAANLSQTVIDEWRTVVEKLEELIKQ